MINYFLNDPIAFLQNGFLAILILFLILTVVSYKMNCAGILDDIHTLIGFILVSKIIAFLVLWAILYPILFIPYGMVAAGFIIVRHYMRKNQFMEKLRG